jgi:hypothetical protein
MKRDYVIEVEKWQKSMKTIEIKFNHNIKPMFSDKKEN